MDELTQGYSMFLEDAVKFFADNPQKETYMNSDEYFIAIRHRGKADSLVVYEWLEAIENYSSHIELKKRENEMGKNK